MLAGIGPEHDDTEDAPEAVQYNAYRSTGPEKLAAETARVLAHGNALIIGDAAAHPARAEALRTAGGTVAQAPPDADAAALLAIAAAHGHAAIFCEGGATLAASLIREDRIDRLIWFTGGMVLGADARGALDPLNIARLADAPRFRQLSTERVGPDTLSIWGRIEEIA